MRRGILCAVLLLLSVLLCSHAQAVTRYVDNSIGDCASTYNPTTRACSGGSAQSFDTIQECVNAMAAGDTCYIRGGTNYALSAVVSVQKFCTSGAPCLIEGYPGDTRPMIVPSAAAGRAFWIDTRSLGNGLGEGWLTLKNVDINAINLGSSGDCLGTYQPRITIDGVRCYNAARNGMIFACNLTTYCSTNLIARNNEVWNCGRIQDAADVDTKGDGFYVGAPNGLIEKNLIDGCRGGGIVINYNMNTGLVVRNNTFRNGGLSSPWGDIGPGCCTAAAINRVTATYAIHFGETHVDNPGGPQEVAIYNNTIANYNGEEYQGAGAGRCFNTTNGFRVLVANNTCYNTDRRWIIGCGGNSTEINRQNNLFVDVPGADLVCGAISGVDTNNITTTDEVGTFVNAAAGNFRLISGATAINAGVSPTLPTGVSGFSVDYDGVSRPQGGTWDVGAFEFGTGDTTPPNAPASLTVTVLDTGRITVSWPESTSTDEIGYRLYRCAGTSCTTSGTPHVTLGNVLSYTDLNLDANTVYGYQVTAIDAVPNESTKTTIQYGTTNNHPADALLTHYTFEEGTGTNVDDSSTFDHDGTIQGTPLESHWQAGVIGTYALHLDGDDDGVTVPAATHHDVVQQFTVMGYVRPVQEIGALTGWKTLFLKNYTLYLYASAGTSTINPCGDGAILGGFVNYGGSVNRTVCHAPGLPLNSWTHLALTFDGTTLRLYRDFAEVATLAIAENVLVSTGPLTIGQSQFGERLRGQIDEVKFYNYARSPAEIAAEATDVTDPDPPTNLTLSVVSPVQINASWSPGFDAIGIINHKVYTCSGAACTPANPVTIGNVTTHPLTGLTASTLYRVQVSALDAAGNESTLTTPEEATTSAAGVLTFIGDGTIVSVTGGDSTNFIADGAIVSVN